MPFLFIFSLFSTNSPSFSKSHSLLHPLSIHSRSPCHLLLLSHPFPSLFLLHIGYIRLYHSRFHPISLVFPIYQTISHFPVHHSPPVERYPLFHILIHNFTPTFFFYKRFSPDLPFLPSASLDLDSFFSPCGLPVTSESSSFLSAISFFLLSTVPFFTSLPSFFTTLCFGYTSFALPKISSFFSPLFFLPSSPPRPHCLYIGKRTVGIFANGPYIAICYCITRYFQHCRIITRNFPLFL